MATYVVTNSETDDRNGKKFKTRPPAEKAYAEEIAKGNFVRLIRIDFIGYGKGGAPKEIKRHEGKIR